MLFTIDIKSRCFHLFISGKSNIHIFLVDFRPIILLSESISNRLSKSIQFNGIDTVKLSRTYSFLVKNWKRRNNKKKKKCPEQKWKMILSCLLHAKDHRLMHYNNFVACMHVTHKIIRKQKQKKKKKINLIFKVQFLNLWMYLLKSKPTIIDGNPWHCVN